MGGLESLSFGGLVLTPVGPGETGPLRALFAAPGMADWLPPGGGADPLAAMIATDAAHWAEHGIGRWVVREAEAVVAVAGLTVKPPFPGLNLSYAVHPDHRGRGVASAVARGLAALPEASLPARPVYALILPPNPVSERTLVKAGLAPSREVDYAGRRAVMWLALPKAGAGQ